MYVLPVYSGVGRKSAGKYTTFGGISDSDKGLPTKSELDKIEKEKRKKQQDLVSRLAKNDLEEFKLGFDVGEKGKGDIQTIVRTIERSYLRRVARDKKSRLESIRIGWQLPRTAYGPILEEALPLLLQAPAQVRSLELFLNSQVVPLSTLQTLVSCHTLETLVLCSDQVQGPPAGLSSSRQATQSRGAGNNEHLCVDDNIVALAPYLSASIHSLKLTDCGLQSRHMRGLVSCLREKRNLRCLSLRQNPQLRVDGWEKQFFAELSFLEDLDLSLCDFGPADGLALASAIQDFPSRSGLKGLNLAGNYRLGPSVHAIVEAAGQHGVLSLNCSFCDIDANAQKKMFQTLATMRGCSLRMLAMQGVRIKDMESLIHCVQGNVSLKRLILDHPREPSSIPTPSLVDIKDALKNNFHLEEIRVDHSCCDDHPVLRDLHHELELNRSGRGILDNERHWNWSKVLCTVANEHSMDALYWFLRNGVAARLFHDVTQGQPSSPTQPTSSIKTGTSMPPPVGVLA
eukprot:Nitzschia sp. Nitz4//scaffold143_size57137//11850//13391//NITZ4_006509-RA/size57137-processed-gene-0.47-mRNA-1//-1//CDS//3329536431//2263//frame0